MTKKIPHAMTSEHASEVKKRGGRKESLYIPFVGGVVVSGTKKEDVKDHMGKYHSIKGGEKGKLQMLLRNFSSWKRDDLCFGGKEIIIKLLSCFPNKRDEYLHNKVEVKNDLISYVDEMCLYLCDYDHRYKFFDQVIFNEKVDYLALYHRDIYRVCSREDILDMLTSLLNVSVNKNHQKVVFLYDDKLMFEFEYRISVGKYPSMVLNVKRQNLCLLCKVKGFNCYKIHANYYAYGNAISYLSKLVFTNIGGCSDEIHICPYIDTKNFDEHYDYMQDGYKVYHNYFNQCVRHIYTNEDEKQHFNKR